MEQNLSLTHPELFTLAEKKRSWRGADQKWYEDKKRQEAGCGPVAAVHLVTYLADVRPGWEKLYPSHSRRKHGFVKLMDEMWGSITPGRLGVNTLHKFTRGLKAYGRGKGMDLPVRDLDIPPVKAARPTVDQCTAFIRAGLRADCPVAFLNLSRGAVRELESWHWVTIIGIEEQAGGAILCTLLDGGREYPVDFRLWFQTTRLGGGLLYVPEG